jgi:hypothetical protein
MNKRKRNRARHYWTDGEQNIWATHQRRWRSAAYKSRRAIRRGKHTEGGR